MKKIAAILMAMVLCAAMVCSVSAVTEDFVPSVSVKPAPSLKPHPEHEDCIIVTPVSGADSDELPADVKALFLQVYEDIKNNRFEFSKIEGLNDLVKENLDDEKTADNLVVRDFFNLAGDCDELKHELPEDQTNIALTFDVNAKKGDFLAVMVYADGQWKLVDSVINEDGTVTATFEEFGPVAFLVPGTTSGGPGDSTDTGDDTGAKMIVWSLVALSSLAVVGVLLLTVRRNVRRADSI